MNAINRVNADSKANMGFVVGLLVLVEVRNVYGNDMIYPANQAAELFAALAGKKTLSRADLEKIEGLGFAVEEVTPKKLAA